MIYVVQAGDTLQSIAQRFDLSTERIIADNGIISPNRLAVGQALLLRIPTQIAVVQSGDTLNSIAQSYQTTVNALYQNNPSLEGLPDLVEGEQIVIRFDESPVRSLYVNGYTYPSIDRDVLRATLPYLSYLTSFSYGFREDGTLITPNDEEVLAITQNYPAEPILLLSTLQEDGSFSSEKANQLLSSSAMQDNLFASLLNELRTRRFVGVDVDFEYVDPMLRDAYVQFITRLKEALSPEGYEVFVSLAPKTYATQPGLLYGAHDYRRLGGVADRSLLMTYEWGYRYSEPMAVAPLDKVRAVVEYAVTEIEPGKIFLGLPNYGYDWPLPYVEGETEGRSISNPEAMDLAARYGAQIEFDARAMSPYFRYRDDTGVLHEVWFEDARSIQAKLALASEYGLGGVSVWNLMRYFPGIWSMIASEYQITQPATDM